MRVDEVGDEDGGVARVEAREGAQVGGLADVVELLSEARLDNVEHGLRVEAPAAENADEGLEKRGVREVALYGAGDARVLDFDGDFAAVGQARAVNLADGRAGEGNVVPLGEEGVDGGVELFLDEGTDGLGRGARGLGAQGLEGGLEGRACCSGTRPST